MSEVTNDNDAENSNGHDHISDAHGQAAMLLVESLIHSLITHSVISLETAIEIVDVAADVTIDIEFNRGVIPAGQKMLDILRAISASLGNDLRK